MGQPLLLDVLDEREERYEVIDGSVVVTPPARLSHGRAFRLLHAALEAVVPRGVELLGPEFAELGVPHYWLVDPEVQTIEVLALRGGDYVRVALGSSATVLEPFPVHVDLAAQT